MLTRASAYERARQMELAAPIRIIPRAQCVRRQRRAAMCHTNQHKTRRRCCCWRVILDQRTVAQLWNAHRVSLCPRRAARGVISLSIYCTLSDVYPLWMSLSKPDTRIYIYIYTDTLMYTYIVCVCVASCALDLIFYIYHRSFHFVTVYCLFFWLQIPFSTDDADLDERSTGEPFINRQCAG